MNGLVKKEAGTPVIVLLVAILAITGLELFALSKGVDGKLFALSTFSIGAIAGVNFRKMLNLAKREKAE